MPVKLDNRGRERERRIADIKYVFNRLERRKREKVLTQKIESPEIKIVCLNILNTRERKKVCLL